MDAFTSNAVKESALSNSENSCIEQYQQYYDHAILLVSSFDNQRRGNTILRCI